MTLEADITINNHQDSTVSPFAPRLPNQSGQQLSWGKLYGSSMGLAISAAAAKHDGPVTVITADMPSAEHLEYELRFYAEQNDTQNSDFQVLSFPDRETLPYDNFSPHQDIISQRLDTLYRLPTLKRGILITPISTLMNRLPPRDYLVSNSLMLDCGERIDIDDFRRRLESSGYRCVSQVMEHGEFSVRGSLIDLYPTGSTLPYRIDLLDDEIDSIRTFDPESQRSIEQTDSIRLLPAREFPLTEDAISYFRQNYRSLFEGDPQKSVIYRDISNGLAPAGIEYYLPLFFEQAQSFFDFLPKSTLIFLHEDIKSASQHYWKEINERYEQLRHDLERPILKPESAFINPDTINTAITNFARCQLHNYSVEASPSAINIATHPLPPVAINSQAQQPLNLLNNFIAQFSGRILFTAESTGRRETLLEMLKEHNHYPSEFCDWQAFFNSDAKLGITVASLDNGMLIDEPQIAVIAEAQIFGAQIMQRRRRKHRGRDADAVIKNLTELSIGAPVVHEEHGVGRYAGMQNLEIGGITTEFLTLIYANDAKLYVPVSSLHLISRYTGASPEQAPLHKLGNDQWQRAKRKAAEKVRDVAAELLDIYARREARTGHAFPAADDQYSAFSAAFPFEETPDQHEAINAVVDDMVSAKTMDRLICGDVGFGKTEVAMRATFMAISGNKQVAVLVPTTLLAQQHYENFKDRFADLPVRVELLSRFRTGKAQQVTLQAIEDGKADIVVGTHKLLQESVKFGNLGLVIIDEEHRFGVRQKEKFKAFRSNVDVLTLTATPIPRTLNMAMSGLRDLSIIATPPLRRLAIKTFVREWNDSLLREAVLREIHRGGQVYFLHNEVKNIDKITAQLRSIIPEAQIQHAHGQLRETELEQIMSDFYHQRFNVLVCTTIIESGIDIPNANTIIINRADKLGLAQLYQIRGRVGRSHHQAYAYMIAPPRRSITADADKRLEAIESIEDLGAGFTLATHDLEIRGTGELLGDEQSGQIYEIGFSMYSELLERAVKALKAGNQPELDQPLSMHAEVDLHIPALLPDDYCPDVHSRLVMYKRIASAANQDALNELRVEMIDRFGLLPDAAKNLMCVTELKLNAEPLGIKKIDASENSGRLIFNDKPNIDLETLIRLIQTEAKTYQFDGTNKFSFKLPQGDLEKRLEFIYQLLEKLSIKQKTYKKTR